MNHIFLRHVISISALGLTIALAHTSTSAQSGSNSNSGSGNAKNGNAADVAAAKAVDDNLPKKKPKAVFNNDGTPAGDAALGIAPDDDVALPKASKIQKKAFKHEVKRGKVDQDFYPTGPQPLITKLR